MMTAHVVYPALDPDQPATLSHAICTDLLRNELGFEGVLFSDDLEMKAHPACPIGEAAVLAVIAGCDALLVCSREDLAAEAHAALVREAETSPAFRARCEEAPPRFVAMRQRVRARPAPTKPRSRASSRPSHRSRPSSRRSLAFHAGGRHREHSSGSPPSASSPATRRACTPDNPLGVVEDAVVVYDEHSISWIGPRRERRTTPRSSTTAIASSRRASSTRTRIRPGSARVTTSTRCGWRAPTTARSPRRAEGSSPPTARSQARPKTTIADELAARLRRMAELGVTTVEVKSGYGLEPDGERKQLRAIARARAATRRCRSVVATYLALHALPESAKASRDHYVLRASTVARAGGRDSRSSRSSSTRTSTRTRSPSTRRASSASPRSARASACGCTSGSSPTSAARSSAPRSARAPPTTSSTSTPTASRAREGGRRGGPAAGRELHARTEPRRRSRRFARPASSLVVASDANPGTAPTESLPLAMALAVRMYGLTPAEAILGATRNAATSLGLAGHGVSHPRGALAPGARADMVVWDLPHELAIVQPWGVPKTYLVLRARPCRSPAPPDATDCEKPVYAGCLPRPAGGARAVSRLADERRARRASRRTAASRRPATGAASGSAARSAAHRAPRTRGTRRARATVASPRR